MSNDMSGVAEALHWDEPDDEDAAVTPPFMATHDAGCQCWPHVSQQDAVEAIAQAGGKGVEIGALAEYRAGRAARPSQLDPATVQQKYLNDPQFREDTRTALRDLEEGRTLTLEEAARPSTPTDPHIFESQATWKPTEAEEAGPWPVKIERRKVVTDGAELLRALQAMTAAKDHQRSRAKQAEAQLLRLRSLLNEWVRWHAEESPDRLASCQRCADSLMALNSTAPSAEKIMAEIAREAVKKVLPNLRRQADFHYEGAGWWYDDEFLDDDELTRSLLSTDSGTPSLPPTCPHGQPWSHCTTDSGTPESGT